MNKKDDDDLFKAYARRTDPDTSHDAAASMDSHVTKIEAQVYAAIKRAGSQGATCDEIVDLTGLNWNTVSPRLKPLREKRRLIKALLDRNGEVVKRYGKSKRQQIVWVIR